MEKDEPTLSFTFVFQFYPGFELVFCLFWVGDAYIL